MKFIIPVAVIMAVITGCGENPDTIPDPDQTGRPIPDTIAVFPSDTIGIMMGDSNYVFGTISDALELDDGSVITHNSGEITYLD